MRVVLCGLLVFGWLMMAMFAHATPLGIFPPPREVEVGEAWHLRLPIRIVAPSELQRAARFLRSELQALFGKNAVSAKGKTIVSLQLSPKQLTREEEYLIEADGGRISIRCHDLQGAFWAGHTLRQVLTSGTMWRTPKGWKLPAFTIRDYPESPHRAFMIQAAWAPDIRAIRAMVELLARMKVRYVAIEFGSQLVLDLDPNMATGARFSKRQAKELIEYARSLGIEPIGYLNLLGHLDRAYQKPPYTNHGGIMIQDGSVYERFIFPILDEMLDVNGKVRWFHCGMDEAWELFEWLSREGYDSATLLAQHIRRVHDYLQARGVRLVIWHDMLFAPELEKEVGAPIGPANGGAPRNTSAALDKIPKSVILNYWFYDPLPAYPALDWLQRKGFEVWASPWQTPFSLVRYAQSRGAPTMGTIWADPPGCLTDPAFLAVPVMYAWAAWNPASAPADTVPELKVQQQAIEAALRALWGRPRLGTDVQQVLLIQPERKSIHRLRLPDQLSDVPEQLYGVPFDFSAPLQLSAIETDTSTDLRRAKSVVLPDGRQIPLDGVNKWRGEDDLILYTGDLPSTGTNVYGGEALFSSRGQLVSSGGYGGGNRTIPAGGFALSAHMGPSSQKYHAIMSLRLGDFVQILDEEGNPLLSSTVRVRLSDGSQHMVDVQQPELSKSLTERSRWSISLNERLRRFYFVVATQQEVPALRTVGEFIIRYQDGSEVVVPIRAQAESSTSRVTGFILPDGNNRWFAWRDTPEQPILVREWTNPNADKVISELVFLPSAEGLLAGLQLQGITAEKVD
jgi:hypothetical protein